MKERDIIRRCSDGVTGVVLATIHMLREDGPWSAIFEDSGVAIVLGHESEYEVIGCYEAVPDADGCGMGKESQCCRFLGVARDGLNCLRFGEMHWRLVFGNASAAREPNGLYPDCKLK